MEGIWGPTYMTLVGAEVGHLQCYPDSDSLERARCTGLGSKLTHIFERLFYENKFALHDAVDSTGPHLEKYCRTREAVFPASEPEALVSSAAGLKKFGMSMVSWVVV